MNIVEKQTSYKFNDGNKLSTNFIYSYTTGDLLFKSILQKAFGVRRTINLENDIYVDVSRGTVQYHGSTLAQVAGNEGGTMKVALYARVSSERQDVDLSISTQIRALRTMFLRKKPWRNWCG